MTPPPPLLGEQELRDVRRACATVRARDETNGCHRPRTVFSRLTRPIKTILTSDYKKNLTAKIPGDLGGRGKRRLIYLSFSRIYHGTATFAECVDTYLSPPHPFSFHVN